MCVVIKEPWLGGSYGQSSGPTSEGAWVVSDAGGTDQGARIKGQMRGNAVRFGRQLNIGLGLGQHVNPRMPHVLDDRLTVVR